MDMKDAKMDIKSLEMDMKDAKMDIKSAEMDIKDAEKDVEGVRKLCRKFLVFSDLGDLEC